MNNEAIKKYMRNHGVRQWQLAHALGVSENTILRRLRMEMGEEEYTNMIRAIDSIIEKREAENE